MKPSKINSAGRGVKNIRLIISRVIQVAQLQDLGCSGRSRVEYALKLDRRRLCSQHQLQKSVLGTPWRGSTTILEILLIALYPSTPWDSKMHQL
jgi:hypothetical protein